MYLWRRTKCNDKQQNLKAQSKLSKAFLTLRRKTKSLVSIVLQESHVFSLLRYWSNVWSPWGTWTFSGGNRQRTETGWEAPCWRHAGPGRDRGTGRWLSAHVPESWSHCEPPVWHGQRPMRMDASCRQQAQLPQCISSASTLSTWRGFCLVPGARGRRSLPGGEEIMAERNPPGGIGPARKWEGWGTAESPLFGDIGDTGS